MSKSSMRQWSLLGLLQGPCSCSWPCCCADRHAQQLSINHTAAPLPCPTPRVRRGQRKRVTTAEVLCGPQSVVLMDEISTGLDRWAGGWVGGFARCAHVSGAICR